MGMPTFLKISNISFSILIKSSGVSPSNLHLSMGDVLEALIKAQPLGKLILAPSILTIANIVPHAIISGFDRP